MTIRYQGSGAEVSKTGRYYWLKMPKDFFKRHDIKIIEGFEDGKAIVLFYIKLLCESIDHNGRLRYSDEIPYTEDMLSAVTNTDKNIVTKAMELLQKLALIKVLDDKTIFMTQVPKMTGSETESASYMREYRAQQEVMQKLGEFGNVTLSKDEISKLKEFYPSYWIKYVEKLSMHKKSTGKEYASDYATIRQWLAMDVGELE